MQPRSIRFRLASTLLFVLLLVIVMGALSIERLREINDISADIRNRALQNTQYLGDLNNYTSDFRTAEATDLVAANADEIAEVEATVRLLDSAVVAAQHNYSQIAHDDTSSHLYRHFDALWSRYHDQALQVIVLLHKGQREEAIRRYKTSSRVAYDAASDALGQLTSHNVANDRMVSEEASNAYRQARLLTLTSISVAALFVLAAIIYITRSISGPLHDLAICMRQLANHETSIDIPWTQRVDEIGELARTVVVFRETAVELALSHHELEGQASVLKTSLARERLVTTLQRDFVSMASHEFRTPLTVIDAHAQRLIKMRDRLTGDDIAQRAGKVRAEVSRMTYLLSNLLDASKLIDGDTGLAYHPTTVDLASLMRDICRSFRDMAPLAELEEKLPVSLPMVGDAKLLHHVASNLLSNAIKYSPNGGLVSVVLEQQATQAVIVITDHGLGIPPEDLPQLFNRYHRGSNVTGIAGTGVGLYLVKVIIELHQGEIRVDSQQGHGARFEIRLPLGDVAARAVSDATGPRAGMPDYRL